MAPRPVSGSRPVRRRRSCGLNPTRVRLKLGVGPPSRIARPYFNPTRVRLKRGSSAGRRCRRRDFNPTRVRLKPRGNGRRSPRRPLQPHKGASETRCISRRRHRTSKLQPHKGASETGGLPTVPGRLKDFNPTRVRLKRGLVPPPSYPKWTSTPQGCV